jgi:cubilin
LDIQSQFGCRSAGVEIRNGGTLTAPGLGRYCGRNPPGSIFSTGNSLHVRYFNSLQNPGTGFQARVSIGISATKKSIPTIIKVIRNY